MNYLDEAKALLGNVKKAVLSFTDYESEDGDGLCHFTVQYNPSTLNLVTSSETSEKNFDQYVKIKKMIPTTTLTVKLLFDEVNNQDAFLWEKFSLSLNSILPTVTSIVSQSKKTPIYSVKNYVEALLKCASLPYTTWAEFQWGSMHFSGELQNVTASYTMFNYMGEPICAEVNLSIQDRVEIYTGYEKTSLRSLLPANATLKNLQDVSQGLLAKQDISVEKVKAEIENKKSDNKYWEEALNKFIGDDSTSLELNNNSPLDNLSAVLNL